MVDAHYVAMLVVLRTGGLLVRRCIRLLAVVIVGPNLGPITAKSCSYRLLLSDLQLKILNARLKFRRIKTIVREKVLPIVIRWLMCDTKHIQ